QFRDDVYGRDARMIAILKGSERKVADIAIERKPDASSKPVKVTPGMYGGAGGGWGGGGGGGSGFFGMLFGGNRPQVEPPGYRPRGFIGSRAANNARFYH